MRRISKIALLLGFFAVSSIVSGQTLQPGYFTVEGRKVYYESKGQGFDAFAKHYRVIRYDMSGYGRSSIPDSAVSSSNEIAALLKHLGVSKAIILGMSLGGWVAIRFTIDYPQMVERLITLGANLEGFQFTDEFTRRLGAYPVIARDSGVARAKAAWLGDPFMTPATNVESVNTKIRTIITDWSAIQFTNPSIWSFRKTLPPAIRRLHEIQVPALVITGENDDPNMRAIADTLAENIAGARMVLIAGSGHLANLERPDEFNRLIMDFISGQVGTR